MKKGLDAKYSVANYAAAFREQGYDFVGRYYNVNDPAKNLTPAEAHTLSGAGLGIVAVWENGNPTYAGHFEYARGVYDGINAYWYAQNEIQQPADTPIYFAVDYDASQSDIDTNIRPYFQGVKAGFDAIGQNKPIYSIGVYGSGLVCTVLLSAGLATFFWLSQSTSYYGTGTFEQSGKANIIQSLGTIFKSSAGDVSIDNDTSPNDNEGSFTVKALAAS